MNITQTAQIRNATQSSSTFIKISGPIPEIKKSGLINAWENIFACYKEYEQNEAMANKLGNSAGSRKLCIFASFKMTHNCYISMNISFYSKTENSIINCVPSLLKAYCAERLSSKNKIKDT